MPVLFVGLLAKVTGGFFLLLGLLSRVQVVCCLADASACLGHNENEKRQEQRLLTPKGRVSFADFEEFFRKQPLGNSER